MKKLVSCLCMVCFVGCITTHAEAGFGPADLAIIAKLAAQLKQLKSQYDRLGEQLKTAKKIASDNEGNYGYGGIGNSDSAFRNRTWSPDTWDDAIKDLSGGNQSRYKQLLSQYDKEHPTLSENAYSKGASHALVRAYLQNVKTNKISSFEATHAFNSIKHHLQDIRSLTGKIDQTPNSKAAMDLNSRLVAEVAFISAQELKMQALMNQQLLQESINKNDGMRRESIFNRLPSA